MPSSLNRAATVPKTGTGSGWLCDPGRASARTRRHWRSTERNASSAPRRSNLLMATTSARSSMSIFSSWDGAPNSGVITYSDTSATSTIAALPWPIPGVSTMTRSKPAAR